MKKTNKIPAIIAWLVLVLTSAMAHGDTTPLAVDMNDTTVRISNTNTVEMNQANLTVSSPTLTIDTGLSEILPEGTALRLKSITLGQEGNGIIYSTKYTYARKIRLSCEGEEWTSSQADTNRTQITCVTGSNTQSFKPCVYSFDDCRLVVGKTYSVSLFDENGENLSNVRYRLAKEASTVFSGLDYNSTWTPVFILDCELVVSSSININFDNEYGLNTTESLGLEGYEVPGNFWNCLVATNNATLAGLAQYYSNGMVTTNEDMSVTVTGTRGHYYCPYLDYRTSLLHGYIDDNDSYPTPTVTVTGVPYDKYRVVVYHSTDTMNAKFGYDLINGVGFCGRGGRTLVGTENWGDSGPDQSANAIAEGVNTLVTPVLRNNADSTLEIVSHSVYVDGYRQSRSGIAAIQIIDASDENDYSSVASRCGSSLGGEGGSWIFPDDALVLDPKGNGGLLIGTNGVSHEVSDVAESSGYVNVVASVLAELPEDGEGTLLGLGIAGDNDIEVRYTGDGSFLMTFNDQPEGTKNNYGHVVTLNVDDVDVKGAHVWSLFYSTVTGTELYRDGVLLGHASLMKWNNNGVTPSVESMMRHGGGNVLTGAKFYSAYTHYWATDANVATNVYGFYENAQLADASIPLAYKGELFEHYFVDGDTEGLAALQPHRTSTLESGVWSCPLDATLSDGEYVDALQIASSPVEFDLGGVTTNAVAASVLAEITDVTASGTLMSFHTKNGNRIDIMYNGDGRCYTRWGDGEGCNREYTEEQDVSGVHVWTLVYYNTDTKQDLNGTALFLDGELVVCDTGLRFSGDNGTVRSPVCFGVNAAYANPLSGLKIYAVHTDFGADAAIFDAAGQSAASTFGTFDFMEDLTSAEPAVQLAAFQSYVETGYAAYEPTEEEITHECVLRVSEVMPKPTDAQDRGALEGMDVNGLESGWVELENTSDMWADLADYRFIRVNRGSKTDAAGSENFPRRLVAPHSRTVFYTSERYPNSDDDAEAAFAEGTFDAKPTIFPELNDVLVWGKKVNPKKSPFVRLYYAPGGDGDKNPVIVDTVVIPSDLPEGCSIIVGDTVEGEATKRWLCTTPTRGTANTATDNLTPIGPNCGPLYEIAGGAKHSSKSEFDRLAIPAKPGEDYTITFSLNPVMSPTEAAAFRGEDAIEDVILVYRTDLDNDTLAMVPVDLLTGSNDTSDWGWTYTATIPASALPAAGHLIQWKFIATDASGNDWTSPSFNNPDDGYEWYGTIVEPTADQQSATLPTWHMFIDDEGLAQMNYDKNDPRYTLENGARVAIYDSSTSNYYDYVRIDLRGHTSGDFTKKGHGLRFAKAHPLTMTDVVTGDQIKDIRKTSLISEFGDPSFMRQMVGFWLWRKMGNLVPFDFPVRCNLNGEFYQLAFNSERFTDELIEDVYGLDKFGYSYKNVGTLQSEGGTSAGSIEKKTPDDENEGDLSVLQNELRAPLYELGVDNVRYDVGGSTTGLDNAELTKFVVQKFNLPAWLNYLASARITQEMDDVWANVCIYYDNAEMNEGVRGTDTWMPLGYDFNISFGQYYRDNGLRQMGLMSTNDWFKSHPFYGGNRVRCWSSEEMAQRVNEGNRGFEAVWQSAKFRRLYLRRLRTLMDQELKTPGTPEQDVPFMAKMRELADIMRADAALDQAKWPNDASDDWTIDVWPSGNRPANMDAGIDDIWNNYVVPRREHLYVTHSVTNTAKAIGYGTNLNAGIPESQSPVAQLAPNIYVANTAVTDAAAIAHGVFGAFEDGDVCIIYNGNDEAVDMSGWTLSGAVGKAKKKGIDPWTFPAGSVCDANDFIYVVRDRRAFVEANEDTLTDQVIIGNAPFAGNTTDLSLAAADGTEVWSNNAETEIPAEYSILSSTIDGREDWWTWSVPANATVATQNDVVSVTLNGAGIAHGLGDVVTNAVIASVWAEIPENAQGAVIGFCDANSSKAYSIYAYANGDGTFTMYYDDSGTMKNTKVSITSSVRDLARPHLWTLAYCYNGGLKFYEDGVEIASDTSIKWTQSGSECKPAEKISFGDDVYGNHPLAGMKVYSATTGAASDDTIYNLAEAEYAESVTAMPVSTDGISDPETKAAIIDNYVKYGITDETVKVNGTERSFATSAAAIKMFGLDALGEDGVSFNITNIDVSAGKFSIGITPAMQNGTLSVMAKRDFADRWQRVLTNPSGGVVSIDDADMCDYRFFQIRAELGEQELGGYPIRETNAFGDSDNTKTTSHFTSSATGGDTMLFSVALTGGEDGDYAAQDYRSIAFELTGVAAGAAATLYTNGVVFASTAVDDDGIVEFSALPVFRSGTTLSVGVSTAASDGRISTTTLAERAGVTAYSWADGAAIEVEGGVTNTMTLLAKSPLADGLGLNEAGVFRIPAIAKATNDVVLAVYDCRYNSGSDLGYGGTNWPIEPAGNISTDGGLTWSRPFRQCDDISLSYDVDYPLGESEYLPFSRELNFGDPCIVYDPGMHKFWMMGITGGGLMVPKSGGNVVNDVVLYSRGGDAGDTWGNRKTIKTDILATLAEIDDTAEANEANIRGILQGPGHGIVQRQTVKDGDDKVVMPAGAIIFPMQYFASGSLETSSRTFAIYSTDGGETWKTTKLAPFGENSKGNAVSQENSIIELDDGSWLMMAKGGWNSNSKPTRHFFRSTDFVNWTWEQELSSIWVQGSCLWLDDAMRDSTGASRYVACFATSSTDKRSKLTLHFGRDTTGVDGATKGVAWDCGKVVLYPESMGGFAYSSLFMLDDHTLGVLFETQFGGHIYLRKVDVREILEQQ